MLRLRKSFFRHVPVVSLDGEQKYVGEIADFLNARRRLEISHFPLWIFQMAL